MSGLKAAFAFSPEGESDFNAIAITLVICAHKKVATERKPQFNPAYFPNFPTHISDAAVTCFAIPTLTLEFSKVLQNNRTPADIHTVSLVLR
jgi:hypothetical protein